MKSPKHTHHHGSIVALIALSVIGLAAGWLFIADRDKDADQAKELINSAPEGQMSFTVDTECYTFEAPLDWSGRVTRVGGCAIKHPFGFVATGNIPSEAGALVVPASLEEYAAGWDTDYDSLSRLDLLLDTQPAVQYSEQDDDGWRASHTFVWADKLSSYDVEMASMGIYIHLATYSESDSNSADNILNSWKWK